MPPLSSFYLENSHQAGLGSFIYRGHLLIWGGFYFVGTTPLTDEHAQATLRGRPRGRLGRVGSGKGCLRGRHRGRFGSV